MIIVSITANSKKAETQWNRGVPGAEGPTGGDYEGKVQSGLNGSMRSCHPKLGRVASADSRHSIRGFCTEECSPRNSNGNTA